MIQKDELKAMLHLTAYFHIGIDAIMLLICFIFTAYLHQTANIPMLYLIVILTLFVLIGDVYTLHKIKRYCTALQPISETDRIICLQKDGLPILYYPKDCICKQLPAAYQVLSKAEWQCISKDPYNPLLINYAMLHLGYKIYP